VLPRAAPGIAAAALKDNPGVSLSPHQTIALPMPNSPGDDAYFRLVFDVNLRDDTERPIKGADAVGSFDYVIRVKGPS
jgi:hypothetical protein